MTITYKEVFDLHKKKTRFRLFSRAYFGCVTKAPEALYGPLCRFFSAYEGDIEVGFIRITNYTNDGFAPYKFLLWCASDAYVKPQYRNRGVFKNMLQYVIDCHFVQMILLKKTTYNSNKSYYESMNFCNSKRSLEDPELFYYIKKNVPPFFLEQQKTLVLTTRYSSLLGRFI